MSNCSNERPSFTFESQRTALGPHQPQGAADLGGRILRGDARFDSRARAFRVRSDLPQSVAAHARALRYWYVARMLASALIRYRRDARRMIGRTSVAYHARSRVSRTLVDRHRGVDLVLQIAANSANYRGKRPSNTRFAVYTDYMNLLSKALPDYGFALEERKVQCPVECPRTSDASRAGSCVRHGDPREAGYRSRLRAPIRQSHGDRRGARARFGHRARRAREGLCQSKHLVRR